MIANSSPVDVKSLYEFCSRCEYSDCRYLYGCPKYRAFVTGKPIEEVANPPNASGGNDRASYGETIEYDGKRMSRTQWAKYLGIPTSTFIRRLKGTTDISRALVPKREPMRYAYKGRMMTMREIANEIGSDPEPIRRRVVRDGYTVEEAVTEYRANIALRHKGERGSGA